MDKGFRMTEAKNNTVLEMNKTVEQMLAQGQWQEAIEFWINKTDSLLCLRWIQSINLPHGNILFWVKTHNRNLV